MWVLTIFATLIALISFLDNRIIDKAIVSLIDHQLLLALLTGILASFLVSMYLYFITKMIKRKKVGVFLSYAHSSKGDVDKIRKTLRATSNFEIYDFDSIIIGQNIQEEITNMMSEASLFIMLIDEIYLQSDHCLEELGTIINSEKAIIPILASSDYIKKLPPEILRLKYLVISDNNNWETAFRQSLHEQYKQIRMAKAQRH